jgi:ADP-L-glycero-D-manno-heptose 6-epimerase
LFQGSEGFKRDFVPVERIVDVHKKFFNVKESGLWNLGTGIAKSFQEVAEEIAAKHSAKIEYIPMPDNLKNHYQRYTCADLSNLNKALNENNS